MYDDHNVFCEKHTTWIIILYKDAITEMEDIAVALTAKRYGLLDRLIILRVAVNMDVFPEGVSPETIWDPASRERCNGKSLPEKESTESRMMYSDN